MKNRLESYLAFVPVGCRWLLFFVLPVFMLMVPFLLQQGEIQLIQYLVVSSLMSGEILMDHWVFGGIAMKNGLQLEYFKTSKRGAYVVRDALCVNLLRQFLESVAVSTVCGSIFCGLNGAAFPGKSEIWSCLCMLFIAYVCVAAALLITRFFDGVAVNLLAGTICSILLLGACYFAKYYYAVTLPVTVISAILVSLFSVKLVMKRVRESYYDKSA